MCYFFKHLCIVFCILNFVTLMLDNVSVLAMLEISNSHVGNGDSNTLQAMGSLLYEKHYWTHYMYLLISCFPVFVLYYGFYISKIVPRVISIFGIFAVILMFIQVLFSIFGQGISMNMMLPMGLIQLVMPLWLIIKGFNAPLLKEESQ